MYHDHARASHGSSARKKEVLACRFHVRAFITVESEEVGLSPCLRPLAQTARAVFPQAAFLYGRRAGVRSIVMPGTRLIRRISLSITSHSLTGAFRRVKFRIWSLNLSTDLARGMAYKSSGLALVVRLWAAIRSPLPRLILYPRNSNPSATCTMRVFSG